VIVYVDLEHERLRDQPEQHEKSLARRLKQKYRFEDIAGQPCLLVRYPRASPDLLREVNARAVLVSGAATDFEHYTDGDLAGLRAIYRQAGWPLLGLCAGHQMLAEAHGVTVDAMGPLKPGEPDPYAGSRYPQGVRQERGFKPLRLEALHGLWEGLPQTPVFFESHYWEVKSVPEGFRLLASTDTCGIQAMADDKRRLYGTQFHPEEYDDEHPDGRRLLENFFRIAGVL
jgi:GMP synthase (glutamine-hydrolysing)